MKRTGIFGLVFLLFWAIPFPMIMYYPMAGMSAGSTPIWAFIWLGISITGSLLLLRALFKSLVLSRLIMSRNLNNLMQHGELKTATIISATPLPQDFPGVNKFQLRLELQNFVGTTIHEMISVNEQHPLENRYQPGKKIQLRVDKSLKNIPYLQVDGAHYQKQDPAAMFVGAACWLFLLAVIVGYYIFSYWHENNGTGWRFLIWHHPLVLSPLILLVITFFTKGGLLTQNQLQHKYFGYKTDARVVSVAQTGVYINEQPQVRFDLQYTDSKNRLINVNFKKTIGILDTDLTRQSTFPIFYLESDPQNICLANELEF
jgi:hypothetical protein